LGWRVEFDPDGLEDLRRLDRSVQRSVLKYVRERLATPEDPRRFGKPLSGGLKNLWRYRVGDFRLVCDIREDQLAVLILRIGHRRNVYE
jgi:mRNA interferase RelE/StbE